MKCSECGRTTYSTDGAVILCAMCHQQKPVTDEQLSQIREQALFNQVNECHKMLGAVGIERNRLLAERDALARILFTARNLDPVLIEGIDGWDSVERMLTLMEVFYG